MVTTSPLASKVSRPWQSRMCAVFTNKFTCRRTVPVSSQTLRYSSGYRASSCSSNPRRLLAATANSDAPPQAARKRVETLTLMVAWPLSDVAVDSDLDSCFRIAIILRWKIYAGANRGQELLQPLDKA